MTCLHINLLRLWHERMTESAHEPESAVNIVVIEEDRDQEQFELPLIGDVEKEIVANL